MGRDGLFEAVLQDLVENPAAAPIKHVAQAHKLRQQTGWQLRRHIEQMGIDGVRDARVIQRAVGGRQQHAHLLAERAQVVSAGGGHEHRGQLIGIDGAVFEQDFLLVQKAEVKAHIMTQNRRITDKIGQFLQHRLDGARITHHLVADAGELGDEAGDRPARIDQRGPLTLDTLS